MSTQRKTNAAASTETLRVRVPEAIIKKMDHVAKGKMVSRSDVARWALVKYFEVNPEPKTAAV